MPHEKRQLKPGPKLSYRRPPPGFPTQKTFRAEAEFLEAVEERALQESVRTGLTVTFSDLVRRGLQAVLASELPEYAREPVVPCGLVRTAGGGLACVTCKMSGATRGSMVCPRLKREVKIDE